MVKIKPRKILFILFIFCMVYFSFFTYKFSPYFKYSDDVFALFLVFFLILKIVISKRRKIMNKYQKNMCKLSIFLLLIGLIGNICSSYQTSLFAILVDILSYTKLCGVYVALTILLDKEKAFEYYKTMLMIAKIIIISMLLITFLSIILKIDLGNEYKRYFYPFLNIGGHPSYVAALGCCCISIFLFNIKENYLWIFNSILCILFSQRIKAIGFVAILIVYLFFNKTNSKKGFNEKKIFIYCLIAILAANKYIKSYFLDNTASRSMALIASFVLAKNFFPFGAGFATFGSSGSIYNYSKAYSVVGLSERYGFRPDASSFVGDGGWATQIGQFGYLGTILVLLMIFNLYKDIKEKTINKINTVTYLSIFAYLLICSTSEPAINSNYAVLFAVILAIISKCGENMSIDKNSS